MQMMSVHFNPHTNLASWHSVAIGINTSSTNTESASSTSSSTYDMISGLKHLQAL